MEWIDFEFNFIEALVVGTFTILVYIYQAGVVMDGTWQARLYDPVVYRDYTLLPSWTVEARLVLHSAGSQLIVCIYLVMVYVSAGLIIV